MENEDLLKIEKSLFSDTSKYRDIINTPRHVSQAHTPMTTEDRAAQFSFPGSALRPEPQCQAEHSCPRRVSFQHMLSACRRSSQHKRRAQGTHRLLPYP